MQIFNKNTFKTTLLTNIIKYTLYNTFMNNIYWTKN